MTDTVKRNANGSIDTSHYMKLGRQARSDEAWRMGRATRAAGRAGLTRMRAAVEEITAMPPRPARA